MISSLLFVVLICIQVGYAEILNSWEAKILTTYVFGWVIACFTSSQSYLVGIGPFKIEYGFCCKITVLFSPFLWRCVIVREIEARTTKEESKLKVTIDIHPLLTFLPDLKVKLKGSVQKIIQQYEIFAQKIDVILEITRTYKLKASYYIPILLAMYSCIKAPTLTPIHQCVLDMQPYVNFSRPVFGQIMTHLHPELPSLLEPYPPEYYLSFNGSGLLPMASTLKIDATDIHPYHSLNSIIPLPTIDESVFQCTSFVQVGNLSGDVDEMYLKKVLQEFKLDMVNIKLMHDIHSKEYLGIAQIQFATSSDAAAAMQFLKERDERWTMFSFFLDECQEEENVPILDKNKSPG